MKHSYLLIIFLLIITGCTPNIEIDKTNITIDQTKLYGTEKEIMLLPSSGGGSSFFNGLSVNDKSYLLVKEIVIIETKAENISGEAFFDRVKGLEGCACNNDNCICTDLCTNKECYNYDNKGTYVYGKIVEDSTSKNPNLKSYILVD